MCLWYILNIVCYCIWQLFLGYLAWTDEFVLHTCLPTDQCLTSCFALLITICLEFLFNLIVTSVSMHESVVGCNCVFFVVVARSLAVWMKWTSLWWGCINGGGGYVAKRFLDYSAFCVYDQRFFCFLLPCTCLLASRTLCALYATITWCYPHLIV